MVFCPLLSQIKDLCTNCKVAQWVFTSGKVFKTDDYLIYGWKNVFQAVVIFPLTNLCVHGSDNKVEFNLIVTINCIT